MCIQRFSHHNSGSRDRIPFHGRKQAWHIIREELEAIDFGVFSEEQSLEDGISSLLVETI
jgi:hypothetical protein